MLRSIIKCAIATVLLLPSTAGADPITLKLSFVTSDRSNLYQFDVRPFVDAVNVEGKGLIQVKVFFSGTISKSWTEQASLVSKGTADIAIVIPGYQPELFPDSGVMELPGLFRNAHEASGVFTQLTNGGVLAGYKDYFVLGAFVSEGESIHSRKAINSLADLKGQTIRTNNRIETSTLKMLGAVPVVIPLNLTTDAISQGKIDGATIPPAMLFEFGIGRVANHHYMIHLGGAPVTLLMNRKKFERLPPAAQAIIRKYSGKWLSEYSATAFDAKNREILHRLEADSRRAVVFPSQSDVAASRRVFDKVINEWGKAVPRNGELLARVKAEITKLRSSE